jgi:hypothetical protein
LRNARLARPAPSPELWKDLAPTGKLRAAINFGNAVLAQGGGEPKGRPICAAHSRRSACDGIRPTRGGEAKKRKARLDIGFMPRAARHIGSWPTTSGRPWCDSH